jgi:hypothetical protein
VLLLYSKGLRAAGASVEDIENASCSSGRLRANLDLFRLGCRDRAGLPFPLQIVLGPNSL